MPRGFAPRGGLVALRTCAVVSAVLAVVLVALVAQPSPAVAQGHSGTVPVAIDIARIGVHAQVVPLGEEDDGTMQAPADPDTVGWYAPGAGIGSPGNALLDGHVDWGGRLRVFGLLRTLLPGDAITLTNEAGEQLAYEVSWITLYTADDAPLDEIFQPSAPDAEEITLITCGGAFDPVARMYVSRWVVRAVRVT